MLFSDMNYFRSPNILAVEQGYETKSVMKQSKRSTPRRKAQMLGRSNDLNCKRILKCYTILVMTDREVSVV